jgi:protein-disulfide isomerase
VVLMNARSTFRTPAMVGFAFVLIGIGLAALLVCKHVFPELCKGSYGCSIDGVDGCQELAQSKYAKILGIPIALPGLFYYCTSFFLLGMIMRADSKKKAAGLASAFLSLAIFGLVFDVYLGYINFFKLVVYCRLCAYTYICTAGILASAVWIFMLNKKENQETGSVLDAAPAAGFGLLAAVVITGAIMLTARVSASPAADLLPAEKVPEFLTEFRALKEAKLSTDGVETVEGDPGAYIVIHKFADFLCPHCYDAGKILEGASARWPGRIRIYYRQFPLDGLCNPSIQRRNAEYGPMRCDGATATICSVQQKIFPKMHHGVFALQRTPDAISRANLQRLTEKLGGNWQQLQACMASPLPQAAIARDVKAAESIDLNSTPVVVVQGRVLPAGTPDPKYFRSLIDALVFEKEGQAGYDEFARRGR